MKQQHIISQDTGERLALAWSDGYGTFSTESQYEGRFFTDFGDGRLYEILERGRGQSAWTRNDTYLVIIGADGKPVHGGCRCIKDVPGKWTARRNPAVLCKSGWHACTPDYLARWCYTKRTEYLPIEVWECELENASEPDGEGKVVGTRRKRTRCLGRLDKSDIRQIAVRIAHQSDAPTFYDRYCFEAVWAAWTAWMAGVPWTRSSRIILDYLEAQR